MPLASSMQLGFTYGTTRWVLLIGPYAIKVARFRPLRPFIKLFTALQKQEVRQSLHKHDKSMIRAALKYLFAGIYANRIEHHLYRKYKSDHLIPTLFTICWIVNVQVRGDPITDVDVGTPLFKKMRVGPNDDLMDPRQWCSLKGTMKLVDYGRSDLEPALASP